MTYNLDQENLGQDDQQPNSNIAFLNNEEKK